jgi:MFS transporter, MHS family, proline/betaine transporter
MKKSKSRKVIAAAMIGNALEYYDFNLFVYLAPVISPLFFPSEDKFVSIIVALGTYAVGYFMRPLGAVAFGYIGDCYGRKRALTLSIILMAIPTFLMGLLPSYETIGVLAPIALVLLRLLQGFCTGGEYNGAGILTVENVDSHKAGFAGGMITASSAIGFLMGSTVASLCLLDIMPFWAWRVAFLFGIIVGFIGLYLRNRIPDAYFTKILSKNKQTLPFPLIEVLKKYPSSIFCMIGIAAFSGIMYHISMTYVSVFLIVFQKWDPSEALLVVSFGILSYIILAPLGGWMSDKFGGKIVMTSGAVATLVGIYPFLSLLTSGNTIGVVSAQFILVVLAAWFQGPMNLFMASLFSPETRYSGLAFSYNVGIAMFGGTTSMICMFLVNWTNNPVAPAFYAILGASIGLVSVIYAKQRSQLGREDFSQEAITSSTPSYNPA